MADQTLTRTSVNIMYTASDGFRAECAYKAGDFSVSTRVSYSFSTDEQEDA